jgi:caffeoyl-CoA O-methyltransferase
VTELLGPGVEGYAEAHSSAEPDYLARVAEETRRSFDSPQMMVGPAEGRLLQMLVYALQPQAVLEIGTFTGYSAISMAAGLPPGGRIVTCEVNEEHARAARRNIAASPYGDRITVEVGPALDTIARLEGPFGFVFIDADKARYMAYLEAVLPKLAPVSLVAADNTLWYGRVLGDAGPDGEAGQDGEADEDTRALRAFNEAVVADPRLVCTLLTVRDGVTLIRRA